MNRLRRQISEWGKVYPFSRSIRELRAAVDHLEQRVAALEGESATTPEGEG